MGETEQTIQVMQACKTLMKNGTNYRQPILGRTNDMTDKPAAAFQTPAKPALPAANNTSRKQNAMDVENR
jgi:hypothetical protein